MSTKSTTSVPPPTEQELRLYDVGARLGEEQLSAIQNQAQFQEQFSQFSNPLMQSLFQSLGIQTPGIGFSNPNQPLLPSPQAPQTLQAPQPIFGKGEIPTGQPGATLLPSQGSPVSIQPIGGVGGTGTGSPRMFGGGQQTGQVTSSTGQISSDYETGLINQAIEMALASGTSDINTAFQESLDILKQNLAPSLGLRPGDTPILDRGGKLALEASRQKTQLSRGLRGQQAQFLQDLEQRSFSNRAQLLGAIQGGGLGLAGMGGSGNTLAALTSGRINQQSTSGFDPFKAAGGIGGLLYGASLFSSKDYKNRINPVDVFDVLDGLKKLTIDKWTYKGDTIAHIGPYAEDFRELFGVGDGKTIHPIDVIGVALASLKAIAIQMEELHGKAV